MHDLCTRGVSVTLVYQLHAVPHHDVMLLHHGSDLLHTLPKQNSNVGHTVYYQVIV